jgi:hypothetical protein
VYGAALDSLAPAGKPLVVLDSTQAIRRDAPLLGDVRTMGADSSMYAEFRARTRASAPVPRLRTRRRVDYVKPGKLPPARDTDAWAAFGSRHGTMGYYRVSGIGYSSDRRRAILYAVHWCGMRCGESWLVVLFRSPDGWRVEAARMLMVV